jgi:hypothetical protein
MDKTNTATGNSLKIRKPYEKPTPRQLTPEQAKAILERHAQKGEQGAKEFLDLIFRNER